MKNPTHMILEVYIVGNIQPLFRHASMHTRELWNLPLQFLCEYTHNIVHYWIGVFTSSDNRTRTLCIYSWLLSTLLGCGSPGARFHIVHICLMRIFILFLTYTVEQEIDITDKYDLIIGNKNCISIPQRKTQTTVVLRYSLLLSWWKMVMKTICNEIIYRSIEIEESLGKYQRAARSMSSL